MPPFSEVLINQLNDLEVSFKVLAKRLPEAGELLESLGRPVPKSSFGNLRILRNSLKRLRGRCSSSRSQLLDFLRHQSLARSETFGHSWRFCRM